MTHYAPAMTETRTRTLLRCGIAAGPIYLVVGLGQAFTRDGFDMSRHALSLLSNGDLGWIQILNFLLTGVLVLAGALGVRRALGGTRGGTWAPILLAVYGIGLIGAGVFVADPGFGFPPGTAAEGADMSRSGLLHFVFGGIGFYGLIGACFVFARRFRKHDEPGWSLYSALTGAAFLISFGAIASGSTSAATILTFYAAVAWVWIWHSAVLAHLAGLPAATPIHEAVTVEAR